MATRPAPRRLASERPDRFGDRSLLTVVATTHSADRADHATHTIAARVAAHGGAAALVSAFSSPTGRAATLSVSGVEGPDLIDVVGGARRIHGVDVGVRAPFVEGAPRLLALDVDGTLIVGETIDALAQRAGAGPASASITARAMDGDMGFVAALRRRARLLRGLPIEVVDEVTASISLAPGAATLVGLARSAGLVVALVSGGFTQVCDHLGRRLGVDHVVANRLGVTDGVLTGHVVGRVVDRDGKARAVRALAERYAIPRENVIAVGDGANDVAMLRFAGVGVAFGSRDVLQPVANAIVSSGRLDAVRHHAGLG